MPDDTVALRDNQGWDSRVLVVGCGNLVDAFVVVSERYVVIVDTLINPHTAAQLLQIAASRLVDGRKLLVVNTHADWDHCWGNQVFDGPEAAHPAPIVGSRRTAQHIRSAKAAEFLAKMQGDEPGRFDGVRLTPPTIAFEDRLWIDGGDLTLELFPTPGHQPDHIAIWIPQIGMLLAGDAAEQPFPFIESAASLPTLRDSLARMAAFEPREALYCHAPTTAGPALLRQNIAFFDELEARCRAALAGGAPPQPPEDADLEALIGWPYEQVVSEGSADAQWGYRGGYRAAIRMMLEHLGQP